MNSRHVTWLILIGLIVSFVLLACVRENALTTSEASPSYQAATPFPGQNVVNMVVNADPDIAQVEEQITVQIKLSGDNSLCGQSVVVKPVDVILVIDHSGSMTGEPLAQAKIAAQAFVREMDLSTDRVGLVQFTSSAKLLQPLSDEAERIQQAIESISAGGGTAIDAGLQRAFESLNKDGRSDVARIIVLLSDGISDLFPANRVADTAKAAGIRIISVGLGDIDENLMKSIASQDENGVPQFHFSPDPASLEQIYISIARNIREYGLASDLTLSYEVDLYKFIIIPETLDPAGTVSGNTITWEQDFLESGDNIFSFQVRGRQDGKFPVGEVKATFLECEQNQRELKVDSAPEITIEPGPPRCPPTVVPNPCEWWQLIPWWLLATLLLLGLVVLFLWLTPWGKKIRTRWISKPWFCRLLGLLLSILVLVFIALLLRAIQGNLCQADQVYFWKITQDGNVGIYLTRFGDKRAKQVDYLNRGLNCVACHTASSTSQRIGVVLEDQNGSVAFHTLTGEELGVPAINGSYIAWSPDGKKSAISFEDKDIYVLEFETGAFTPLPGASEPGLIETMPSWSHDGLTIAFVRASRTAADTARIDVPADIYTVPAIGGTALPLIGASGDGFNYYPAYSPDGNWLAFTRHLDGEDTYGDDAADVYLVPAKGGQRIFLHSNSEVADSWSSWSPDGKWLGFSSNRCDGQYDIFVAEVNQFGQTGSAYILPAAAKAADEEHQPVWVSIPQIPLLQRVLGLWPWPIPLFLLLLLLLLVCRERKPTLTIRAIDAETGLPIDDIDINIRGAK